MSAVAGNRTRGLAKMSSTNTEVRDLSMKLAYLQWEAHRLCPEDDPLV